MVNNMLLKYIFLFWFGGSTYVTLEVLWRGYSHWTMLLLAGVVFIILGLLNEIWDWNDSLIKQVAVGTIISTVFEFITGCVVNLWLGWNVWDYTGISGNILGQICFPFTILWAIISLVAIVIDDVIRWKFFGEEEPIYRL